MKHVTSSILVICLLPHSAASEEFYVTSSNEVSLALNRAGPGDSIIWRDGVYHDQRIVISRDGTADERITFRAETPGGVTFRGRSRLSLSGDYVDVRGFNWEGGILAGGNPILEFRSGGDHAHHSRVTQSVFRDYLDPEGDESKYVSIYGQNNRFDYNHVSGKRNNGAMLVVWATDIRSDESMNHQIDHNFIGDIERRNTNGWEAIRIGTSGRSSTNGQVLVDSNYFYRASGEIEIISSKTHNNTLTSNVFRESQGNLTLRHGNGGTVDGNWFFGGGVSGTSGIRAYGENHLISNNYLQDLNGNGTRAAITLMAGDPNAPANGAQPVRNVDIVHNTIVDNLDETFRFGANSNGTRILAPENINVANTIVRTAGGPIVREELKSTVAYGGNIFFGAATGVTSDNGIRTENPLLEEIDRVFRPSTNSPAIGAATTGSFAAVTTDIHRQPREPIGMREVGADEVYPAAPPGGPGPVELSPVEPEDVGPDWYEPLTWRAIPQNPTTGSTARFTGAAEQGAGQGATWTGLQVDATAVSDNAFDSSDSWRLSPFGEMIYTFGAGGVPSGESIDLNFDFSESIASGIASTKTAQAALFNLRDYHDSLPANTVLKVAFQLDGQAIDVESLIADDVIRMEGALGAFADSLFLPGDSSVILFPSSSRLLGAQFIDQDAMTRDFSFDAVQVQLTATGASGIPEGAELWFGLGGVPNAISLPGDFDGDGTLDADDLNLLSEQVRQMNADSSYDLSEDGTIDAQDRRIWVEELANTYFGDSNLDGEFNSSDLVAVFRTARYESGLTALWEQGDWNGDGFFTSNDFITAFEANGYEEGPRRDRDLILVPEPSGLGPVLCGLLAGFVARYRLNFAGQDSPTKIS